MIWYGMLATTSYGRRDQADEILVERVALDEPQAPLFDLDRERVAQERGHPAIELDGRDRGAGREQPAGQEAEPRADLQHPVPRHGVGLAQDALEHVDVGEEVLAQPVARPEARVAERAGGRTGGSSRRSAGLIGQAAATAVRRGRARPAPPLRAAGRLPRRSSPRCRCTGPVAERRAACPRASRLAGEPRAQGRVRRHAAAEHDAARADLLGGPDRLRRRARPRPSPGTPRRARPRPASGTAAVALVGRGGPRRPRASPTIRRAAVLRPEKLKSYESPQPRPRERTVVRRRPLRRPLDRRPARVAEPEQPPDLVERLARGVVDGLAEQAVRRGGRASRRGTCGRPTRRARPAGTAAASRSASPGSSSQPA